MGSGTSLPFTRGWDHFKDPEGNPETHKPICFDPMHGFPNGRKKRQMQVTAEELDKWQVPLYERDYCAHLVLDWYKCVDQYAPRGSIYCNGIRHAWEVCQDNDEILRMKEYERERRLLQKERRLKKKLEEEAAAVAQ